MARQEAGIESVTYRFGSFELDLAKAELRAEGVVLPLERQVFALLAFLVENRERLVSKDEIIEKVWDGRVVSDSAVSSRIKSARQALGDDGQAQRYIRTTHRRGFRFVADVKTAAAAVQSACQRRQYGRQLRQRRQRVGVLAPATKETWRPRRLMR